MMSPDLLWLRPLEGACLAKNGRHGEALEILREIEQIRTMDYVDAYHVRAALRRARTTERGFRGTRACP